MEYPQRNEVVIVIPTFNNLEYLIPCVQSIMDNTVSFYNFKIVNNGAKQLEDYVKGLDIIHTGQNLGWMGGINAALKELPDNCKYVLLMNDDTHILPNDYDWLDKLRDVLDKDPTVGAVGPASNVVAGWQNMRHRRIPATVSVKFLIGFCCLIRRELLEQIGGLDESLPGGDDLDWSIAIRKLGYKLIARRDVFVYHHGFVTGTKVRGGADTFNGWNSLKMIEDTNHAIIRKHGFKAFMETVRNQPENYDANSDEYGDENCLLRIVKGKGIDVGCGASKITPETIGVDMIAKGEITFQGMVSDADIKANGDNLPFPDNDLDYVVARHNIEHYTNPIATLKEWHRVLKPGGYVGMTTPDDGRLAGLKLDFTHKHSFSRECMKDMLELCGFEVEEMGGTANQWNFFVIARKPVCA